MRAKCYTVVDIVGRCVIFTLFYFNAFFCFFLYSELSWPLDVVPNAQSIGLLAVQTSTPRNADGILPPLKTPATDFNSHFQDSAADGHPPVWHYQRNEAEADQEHRIDSNHFIPQPHLWPGQNEEKNYMPDDTLRQADFQGDEDDEIRHIHVDHEGYEHIANEAGYDTQMRYDDVYHGQTVVDHGQPAHASHNFPMVHEHNNHLFAYAQSQQNEYGHMMSEHHWNSANQQNQQMHELEQQDVTEVGQLQTTNSRNYYHDDVESEHPYDENHRDVNIAGQPQWSAAATFAPVISNAAHPDHVSVGTLTGFENKMLSTWPRPNRTVAPPRQASGRSPTKVADTGDGDFGGYRVQYRQQGREQFHHTVSAAGDGCQKMTAAQTDAQTTAENTVTERLQQVFLQSGK